MALIRPFRLPPSLLLSAMMRPKRTHLHPLWSKFNIVWAGKERSLVTNVTGKVPKLLAFINARKQNSNNCSLKRPRLSKLIRGFGLINFKITGSLYGKLLIVIEDIDFNQASTTYRIIDSALLKH